MKRISTINGRWDLLYSRFPEIYDRFSCREDSGNEIFNCIKKRINLKKKIILEIGAGTGRYSFLFCKTAKKVYALEPSPLMRKILNHKKREKNAENLYLINKKVEKLKLPNNSVDIIFSSWVFSGIYNWRVHSLNKALPKRKKQIELILYKLEKFLRKNGYIIVVETAPGYYGGELQFVVMGSKEDFSGNFTNWFAKKFGFKIIERDILFKFKSIKEATEIFGFIYGSKVKRHISKNRIKIVKMRIRIMIKQIKK